MPMLGVFDNYAPLNLTAKRRAGSLHVSLGRRVLVDFEEAYEVAPGLWTDLDHVYDPRVGTGSVRSNTVATWDRMQSTPDKHLEEWQKDIGWMGPAPIQEFSARQSEWCHRAFLSTPGASPRVLTTCCAIVGSWFDGSRCELAHNKADRPDPARALRLPRRKNDGSGIMVSCFFHPYELSNLVKFSKEILTLKMQSVLRTAIAAAVGMPRWDKGVIGSAWTDDLMENPARIRRRLWQVVGLAGGDGRRDQDISAVLPQVLRIAAYAEWPGPFATDAKRERWAAAPSTHRLLARGSDLVMREVVDTPSSDLRGVQSICDMVLHRLRHFDVRFDVREVIT